MNAFSIIQNRFILPFGKKTFGNIGVELEFPLINMDKKPVAAEVANGLLEYFLKNGFRVEAKTSDNNPAFISNDFGDVLSFDNSYNNFEFSLDFGDSLCSAADRFYRYFTAAQDFLTPSRHLLCGMGSNPYKQYITKSHVDFPVYNMVDEFLHSYPAEHSFPDFPAYISSVQTHLDLPLEKLPEALTLFARLDFIRGMLFSNSPSWDNDKTLCIRDFLWEKSAFPNTGKVDGIYKNTDDIINDFLTRKMFCTVRRGKYITFPPVTVYEYFKDGNGNDTKHFLSFKNVEITARGTLEIRSDCAQPVSEAFAPPAFSLGILYNMDRARQIMEGVLEGYKTSYLRDCVINGEGTSLPQGLLTRLVETAEDGLKKRKKGEEKLLSPLYERAAQGICPAKKTLLRLKGGESIENIILDYSKI
ncbi:MAG: hypothetical protein BWY15_00881 [Firmicutes bacterium ADurb.Bin193]|nr:MAG: hypothetical protein BWY15_00881 [Firmicutes bacterium ADurb.Bin193]